VKTAVDVENLLADDLTVAGSPVMFESADAGLFVSAADAVSMPSKSPGDAATSLLSDDGDAAAADVAKNPPLKKRGRKAKTLGATRARQAGKSRVVTTVGKAESDGLHAHHSCTECPVCTGGGSVECAKCVGTIGITSRHCVECVGAGVVFCPICSGAGVIEL
jgi:hypothetical protein